MNTVKTLLSYIYIRVVIINAEMKNHIKELRGELIKIIAVIEYAFFAFSEKKAYLVDGTMT